MNVLYFFTVLTLSILKASSDDVDIGVLSEYFHMCSAYVTCKSCPEQGPPICGYYTNSKAPVLNNNYCFADPCVFRSYQECFESLAVFGPKLTQVDDTYCNMEHCVCCPGAPVQSETYGYDCLFPLGSQVP